jgi:Lrp/AsnC family leucine-responsive transcriptional regulator
MDKLDKTDEKIIDLLQANNQLTFAEIAARIGISASSCRRRIEALRRDGVIVADVSIVNPEILGPRLIVVALITLERETPDGHAAFRRDMEALPQVILCYFVAGDCDYVVHLSLESMGQYDALCERAFTRNPLVKRVDSLVVMKEVKAVGPRKLAVR